MAGGVPFHTVPAVNQDGAHVGRACRRRAVDEGEDGEGVLRHSHVRPLGVVILDHRALVQLPLGVPLLTLRDKRDSTLSGRRQSVHAI